MTFSRPHGFVDLGDLKISCGQCIGCRVGKSRSWALRMCHENQMHQGDSSFLTLTYDDLNLPEDRSLSIEHWQQFANKLRKKIGPIRYFHCGEYGGQFSRPHYHAIIFGNDFKKDRVFTPDSEPEKQEWISPLLNDVWGKGRLTVMDFNFATAAYVARYVVKKLNGAKGAAYYENFVVPETGEVFSVKPEYASMSRRPGLGASWFAKFKKDVFPSDECIWEGKRFRPPKYYDKLLCERELKEVIKKRKDSVERYEDDLTPDRLLVREALAMEAAKVFARNL